MLGFLINALCFLGGVVCYGLSVFVFIVVVYLAYKAVIDLEKYKYKIIRI